eukprot:8207322-Pyramimonas_sp.AAC.1
MVDEEQRLVRAATRRPLGPIQTKPREPSPPVEERDFRGVKLPVATLHTPAGVQAVLLQHQGKLRMKDLKQASGRRVGVEVVIALSSRFGRALVSLHSRFTRALLALYWRCRHT